MLLSAVLCVFTCRVFLPYFPYFPLSHYLVFCLCITAAAVVFSRVGRTPRQSLDRGTVALSYCRCIQLSCLGTRCSFDSMNSDFGLHVLCRPRFAAIDRLAVYVFTVVAVLDANAVLFHRFGQPEVQRIRHQRITVYALHNQLSSSSKAR